MNEFGSDFHRICDFAGKPDELLRRRPELLADGRMCFQILIAENRWQRIWIPAYFCYEIVETIRQTGIEIAFYPDFPETDDRATVAKLPFRAGDVLLRMNYFGLRKRRDEAELPVEIIEDHSHGLFTAWARNSNADYCVASLRKTFPLPQGGMLWSPKGRKLPQIPPSVPENDKLAETRFAAMSLKADYLAGKNPDKSAFRQLYLETEDAFSRLPPCAMSELNRQLFLSLDARAFDERKKSNWQRLVARLNPGVQFLSPESPQDTPFSLVLAFPTISRRDEVKRRLVGKCVYPAVLWEIPPENRERDGRAYLSVHCDGRYGDSEMEILADLINKSSDL